MAFVASAVRINEIMYSPSTELGGTYNEWIELYNPSENPINLSNWLIADPDNHTFEVLTTDVIEANGYFILAKKPDNFSQYYNVTCPVARVVFSLNNNGEEVLLKNSSGDVIDNLTYDNSWGADGNGNSLQLINGTWIESDHTAGLENQINETNQTNQTNESVACNLSVSIDALDVINQIDGFSYSIIFSDSVCSQEHVVDYVYWIEDLFGNVVRSLVESNTTMTSQKKLDRSWTPDSVSGSEAYLVRVNVTDAHCDDSNLADNYAEEMFVVRGNELNASDNNSYINITNVDMGSDNLSTWGDVFYVELNVYRGDTNKYAVYVYANGSEKISQESKFYVLSKYTNYSFRIPVQLKPNCDGGYDDGLYSVVVSGLNVSDASTVNVSGISADVCKNITVTEECVCPSCSGGGGSSSYVPMPLVVNEFASIDEMPEEVGLGEAFDVVVNLTNKGSDDVTATLYSYAYDGNEPLTEGGWVSNSKDVEVPAGESILVTLENRLRSDIKLGDYKFKVRVFMEEKHDLIEKIRVIDRVVEMPENTTDSNESVSFSNDINQSLEVVNDIIGEISITGYATLDNSVNTVNVVINGLAETIKAFFGYIKFW